MTDRHLEPHPGTARHPASPTPRGSHPERAASPTGRRSVGRLRRAVAVAAAAVVVLAVAACSDDGDGDAADDTGTTTTVATGGGGSTGVVTSDDPRAAQIVSVVERSLGELDLHSVVFGVWEGDEEITRGAVDAPAAMPPTSPDALVRVGMPMEAMLGTVLLQLDAEGVLGLDEPVQRFVPALVNGDAITPRMLASSTSGTPDFVPDETFQAAVYANPFREWSTSDLLAYAQRSVPHSPPGQGWSYSHTDIALLGTVLEEASGTPLAELLEERIFEPLGMAHSSVHTTNEIGEPAFRAFTHERGVYEESTRWNPTWARNSGNMNAPVAEIGRWLRALNRGELLDDEAHQLMMAPNTAGLGPMTDERYFSFGMLVDHGWIVATPNLQGYQGFTGQLRDPEVTIVVYSTGSVESAGEGNPSTTIGSELSRIMAPDTPWAPTPH